MKVLLFGMLVASPAVAVWKFRGSGSATTWQDVRQVSNTPSAESTVRVPVEVIAAGSAPEWVYIEVAGQALPKPGSSRGSR
jgi:hypothetical protein